MFEDIKLVVFDLDGTIARLDVDWEQLKKELHEYFRDYYGFESDFIPLDKELERVGEELSGDALKEAYKIVEKYELEKIENFTPIEESLELIKELKNKGKILAIFSTNTRKVIEQVLVGMGIREYFDIIVGKEDVRGHKPDPEGLILIKNKANVKTNEMCFIGDKKIDIECGERINVCSISLENIDMKKEVWI